jgi:hypothetical protein
MRKRFVRLRRGRAAERGQALVEFGLVAVIFFLVTFGIFDMARLFESWMSVQHASRESARYAITGRVNYTHESVVVCSTRVTCIEWVGKNSTTGLIGGGPSGSDVQVTYQAWDYTGTGWSGTAANSVAGKECDQVEVKVSYNHKFMTPIVQAFAPSGVNIHGRQRMTNEPFGLCTANDGTS